MLSLGSFYQNVTVAQVGNKNLEIEARYGSFGNRGFHPGVSIQTFSRLQSYYDKTLKAELIQSRDDYQDNIRRTTYSDGSEVWIRKGRPLVSEDIIDYGLRFEATVEEPISPVKNFQSRLTREKTRRSYLLEGGLFRLDLTRVLSRGKYTYEVEVEIIQQKGVDIIPEETFQKFGEVVIRNILKIIQDTHIIYTEEEKRDVTNYVNNIFNLRFKDVVDHGLVEQARNLKLHDMVWGGLIGNEKTVYKVNHKPDGTRRFLVFSPYGLWLLYPPHEFTLVTRNIKPGYYGTVLDGELIPEDKRRGDTIKAKYVYYIINTLSFQGNTDISRQPHTKRMQEAQRIANNIKTDILSVFTLNFRSFSTPDEFFRVMKEMFQEQDSLSYAQDGFIFRAESVEYNPKYLREGKLLSIDQFPIKERRLVKYADVLKWKEVSNLTIDFLIRKTKKGVELFSIDNNIIVPFYGSEENKYQGYLPKVPSFLENVPDESIVEFQWTGNNFTPIIIRTNKVKPNRLEIALDIWNDIQNPITSEMLKGEGFGLMNYSFARIRRGLLYTPSMDETLLVLNAGLNRDGVRSTPVREAHDLRSRGSGAPHRDFSHWRSYQHIIAHEPSIDLLPQLKDNRLDRRVTLVKSFNEIKDKVNVIALIYDVGKYWQSEKSLNELVSLINRVLLPGGRIMFFILNGDNVRELFHPVFTPQFKIDKFDLEGETLQYNAKDNILTLGDVKETPVFISNLIKKIPSLSINEVHRGDIEEFLSLHEKMLSRLHTFGIIEKGNKEDTSPGEKVEEEEEEEQPIKKTQAPSSRRTGVTLPGKRISNEYNLRLLPIRRQKNPNLPAIGEDKYEKLTVTWTKDKVYRIACIGDGSCFFHAYLKGFYEPYQNNNSYKYRVDLVRGFRNELATLLTEEDPSNPGLLFYHTIAKGNLVSLALERKKKKPNPRDDFGDDIDYSLKGMVELLLSSRDVGDEVYSYVTEIGGIGAYIMTGTNKNLYPYISVGTDARCIVIVGNFVHYELIAVERGGVFQTLFEPDDPFIKDLRKYTFTKKSI